MKKQVKKGRPPSENPMVHTAVMLPRDLLERLKMDAERHGIGLSALIRRHLNLVYWQEGSPVDAETRSLLGAFTQLAHFIARDVGKKWHEHAYSLSAFKAGVASLLARYQPDGDESFRPDTVGVGQASDPPDVIGRTHARHVQIADREEDTALSRGHNGRPKYK